MTPAGEATTACWRPPAAEPRQGLGDDPAEWALAPIGSLPAARTVRTALLRPQPSYAVEVRKPLTVNVDEHVLEALQRAAANDGVHEDELVHEALRRYLGLRGLAVLDDIARRQAERGVQLDEDEAMALAVGEVRAARAERRRARGA